MKGRDRKGFALAFVLVAAGVVVVVAIIIVVAVVLLTRPDTKVVKPDENTCQCADIPRMANRFRQAKAAVASIDNLITTQSASDTAAGKPAMYSKDLYNKGKAINQQAVNDVAKGEDYTGAGETPGRNCSTDVSAAPTDCLKQSLQAHENVHQRECLKGSGEDDYKNAKTMVDYWKEDREGYQAEADYLDRNVKRLMNDPKCKPKVSTYTSPESKEDQRQRLAGSRRRVSRYVKAIS